MFYFNSSFYWISKQNCYNVINIFLKSNRLVNSTSVTNFMCTWFERKIYTPPDVIRPWIGIKVRHKSNFSGTEFLKKIKRSTTFFFSKQWQGMFTIVWTSCNIEYTIRSSLLIFWLYVHAGGCSITNKRRSLWRRTPTYQIFIKKKLLNSLLKRLTYEDGKIATIKPW